MIATWDAVASFASSETVSCVTCSNKQMIYFYKGTFQTEYPRYKCFGIKIQPELRWILCNPWSKSILDIILVNL